MYIIIYIFLFVKVVSLYFLLYTVIMKQLILFDIDGTLIRINRAGREAYVQALSALFPSHMTGDFCFSLRGMTDLGVFQAFCRQFGMRFSPFLWKEFSSRFEDALQEASSRYTWEILPGADEMLKRCLKYNIGIGLATGNTREGSRRKLSFSLLDPAGLKGGFGDDSLTKAETLRKALAAFPYVDPVQALYFGDTFVDYEAAHDLKIPFIGIAGLDFSRQDSPASFPVIEDYLSLLQSPSSTLYREIFGKSGHEKKDPSF